MPTGCTQFPLLSRRKKARVLVSIANVHFFFFYLHSPKSRTQILTDKRSLLPPLLWPCLSTSKMWFVKSEKMPKCSCLFMTPWSPNSSGQWRCPAASSLSSPVSVRRTAWHRLSSCSHTEHWGDGLNPGLFGDLGQRLLSSLHARGYLTVEFWSCNVSGTWRLKIELIVSCVVFIGFYVSRPPQIVSLLS